MGNQQLPSAPFDVIPNVALKMPLSKRLGRENVAGPCVMSSVQKGIADDDAEFTRHKYPHFASP